ncbi:MAG: histidinol phosphatase [Clostridia bacterium]|nr:histidinol phosphatase [Clostridia bacterium]
MPFKYELHCHTKEVSRCGGFYAADAVKLYKDAGYDGIVITDHFAPMTFSPSTVWRPHKAVDFYTRGYKEALKAAGDDFTVLLGMELRYYATANDYLVYGITEDFLKSNGNILSMYPKRFYRLAKKNNLIVVQAHPFRDWMIRINPKHLDGAEVFNGKSSREANENAEKWVNETGMKIRVSGSDFHRPAQLAKGGIITETPIKTNDDLLKILNSGDYELIKNY